MQKERRSIGLRENGDRETYRGDRYYLSEFEGPALEGASSADSWRGFGVAVIVGNAIGSSMLLTPGGVAAHVRTVVHFGSLESGGVFAFSARSRPQSKEPCSHRRADGLSMHDGRLGRL
jgi:hypothetical protein